MESYGNSTVGSLGKEQRAKLLGARMKEGRLQKRPIDEDKAMCKIGHLVLKFRKPAKMEEEASDEEPEEAASRIYAAVN